MEMEKRGAEDVAGETPATATETVALPKTKIPAQIEWSHFQNAPDFAGLKFFTSQNDAGVYHHGPESATTGLQVQSR